MNSNSTVVLAPAILLIEDEQSDIDLFEAALAKTGLNCQLQSYTTTADALDHLLAIKEKARMDLDLRPAFIVLDIKLPGDDGTELLRSLRQMEYLRFIPVIIISASDMQKDIQATYALGANSYIVKPSNFSEMLELVKLLCHYWLDKNQTVA
jgi:two-component system, response regulator